MEQEEENIEVGKTYNVRMLVVRTYLSSTGRMCLRACTVDKQDNHLATHILSESEADAFSPINPYQPIEIFKMTEIPESAPKYDPCRPFKKGDIVEPVACNGRAPLYLRKYIGTKQVVECDEDINGIVGIVGDVEAVSAAFLKLVTPVEELEPYIVKKYHEFYAVEKYNNHKDRPATYDLDFHPHAKEAAQAECDRLNAEHRKEQS